VAAAHALIKAATEFTEMRYLIGAGLAQEPPLWLDPLRLQLIAARGRRQRRVSVSASKWRLNRSSSASRSMHHRDSET
jgi:hypothetical protein